MTTTDAQRERALKLAERLLKLTPDSEDGLTLLAMQLRDRLKTPMTVVLNKVLPGSSVTAKCSAIGITRQCYYGWLRGDWRPNLKQAKRLATLTGIKAAHIRGR